MRYEFEIQSLIKVEIDADSAEEARCIVCNQLENGEYDDVLSGPQCYVSDGKEL